MVVVVVVVVVEVTGKSVGLVVVGLLWLWWPTRSSRPRTYRLLLTADCLLRLTYRLPYSLRTTHCYLTPCSTHYLLLTTDCELPYQAQYCGEGYVEVDIDVEVSAMANPDPDPNPDPNPNPNPNPSPNPSPNPNPTLNSKPYPNPTPATVTCGEQRWAAG